MSPAPDRDDVSVVCSGHTYADSRGDDSIR